MPGALNLGERRFAKESHLSLPQKRGVLTVTNNIQAKLLLNEHLSGYSSKASQRGSVWLTSPKEFNILP